MHHACSEYGWHVDYVLDGVPLLQLILLVREKAFAEGVGGWTLMDQEMLGRTKDVPWEELVRRNREQLARQGCI